MDYNYVKPFIESAKSIIKEVTDTEAEKTSAYMAKGKQKRLNGGLYIDISGDVTGRIIFNLSKEMSQTFVSKMIGMHLSNSETDDLLKDPEFVQSAIGELGNLITGRAITALENSHYNCNIYPPVYFTNEDSGEVLEEETVTAVIDFKTNFGDFDICIVDKDDRYSKNLSILIYNLSNTNVLKIMYHFLPRGFYIFSANNRERFQNIISKTNIDYIIGNFDKYSYDDREILSELRKKEITRDIKLGAYTKKTEDEEFLNKLESYDINHIIPQNNEISTLIKGINELLKTDHIGKGERRKQIRISISPKEKYITTLPVKTKNETVNIPGLVIDLSIATMFVLISSKHTQYFRLKQALTNMILFVNNTKIPLNGFVYYKKGNIIGIKLMNITDHSMRMLCDFIYERFNKDNQLRV